MDRPLLISAILRHAELQHPQSRDRFDHRGSSASPLHVPRGLRALAQARERAAAARLAAGRSRRDAGLERLPALRDLLRRLLLGLRLPHHQSAAVRRPDRLHRQSRRGSLAVPRPGVRAADREAAAAAAEARRLRDPHRRRAHAGDVAAAGAQLRVADRAGIGRSSSGPSSTSAPPARCATRRARPAIRRACCTAIARRCCTTYASALPDAMGLSGADVVLPVVPMFHVNAWALPYGCAMVGAKLVFPGPKMGDPRNAAGADRVGAGDVRRRRADRLARHDRVPRKDRQAHRQPEARAVAAVRRCRSR